jgi:hypothetical protein
MKMSHLDEGWLAGWIRGNPRSSASRIASADSAALRVYDWLDYDYDYDYDHDHDDEHEHEQERRLSIFE